ncbi:MAG: outer membrane beta-barrel protein, partial [Bacteroidota bacterium]
STPTFENIGGSVFDPSIPVLELRNQSPNDLVDAIDRFVYLNIPVRLNYKIGDKLSINVGGGAAYLLNSKLKGSIVLDEVNADRGNISLSTSDFTNSGVLNKWDFHLGGGIQYQLSKFLFIEGSYRYGIRPIFNTNDNSSQFADAGSRKDFNRTGYIGLRYRF